MKDVIYNFIQQHMMIHIVLIALCVAATIGAMFVDLVTGVMKARQRGEARRSTGYKKTAVKAKKILYPIYPIMLHRPAMLCCHPISCILNDLDRLLHLLRIYIG